MELEDIILLLNGHIQETSCDEEFPTEELNTILKNNGYSIKFVTVFGETDKHRWYELRKAVYEIFDGSLSLGFVMSPMIYKMYSDNSSYSDICFYPKFVVCEPRIIQSTIYIKKESK